MDLCGTTRSTRGSARPAMFTFNINIYFSIRFQLRLYFRNYTVLFKRTGFSCLSAGGFVVWCKIFKLPGAKFHSSCKKDDYFKILHAIVGKKDSVFRLLVSTRTSFRQYICFHSGWDWFNILGNSTGLWERTPLGFFRVGFWSLHSDASYSNYQVQMTKFKLPISNDQVFVQVGKKEGNENYFNFYMRSTAIYIAFLGCKFRRELPFRHALHVLTSWRPLIRGVWGLNLQNPGHEVVLGA